MNAPLALANLQLIVDRSNVLSIETIPEVILEPYEKRTIPFAISAVKPENVSITEVSFMYHRFFPCTQSLRKRGKRLHATKAQRLKPTYADDATLTIDVGESRPQLIADLLDVPVVLYAGEIVEAVIRLKNVGRGAIEEVQLLMNETGAIRLKHPPSPLPLHTSGQIVDEAIR